MTILLFLPNSLRSWRWLRVADDGIVGEGEGVPATDEPVIAVAPAEAVTLHWAVLPSRSPAQAVAAARLVVAEASAAPMAELHVAVGEEEGGDTGGDRPIGVVAAGEMRQWLDLLAGVGIEARSIIPAPMLIPRPADGYVRAEIAGNGVVRGPTSGFADEARLTELITGGVAPETMGRDAISAALVRAVADPALDLRQGPFALRRRRAIDWALVRRLAWLGLAIVAVTLAIDLVRIVRLNWTASAMEEEADRVARTGLARGETVTDPDRQLTERLTRLRGPGGGFTGSVASIYAAVRTVPGSEVTGLNFQSNGDILVNLATDRESAATDVKRAIESRNFTVQAGTFVSNGGRVTGQLTVAPR